MKIINKLKIFIILKMNIKLLMIEAFILLAYARIIKKKPFPKIAPLLGTSMEETSYSSQKDIQIIKEVSYAVNIISKYTFWESMCLVRAIAAMKMLEKRKIESTLYLGISKDEHGNLIAHAWLRSGNYYLTGSEGMKQFTVVGTFAKKSCKNDRY